MRLPGVECSVTTAPIDSRLKVTKSLGAAPKQRKTFAIAGLSPPVNYAVYTNNIDTLVRALSERVYFVKGVSGFVRPPEPRRGIIRTTLQVVKAFFKNNSRSTTPMKSRQFAETYQGRKRARYLRACDSLDIIPVRAKDSNTKAFFKFEEINFSAKPDSAPRAIQPRDDRYLVSVGRFCKPIEKLIYTILDYLFGAKKNARCPGDRTVFKGLNASERGAEFAVKWSKFTNPVAISMDASRFDQHVSVDALSWEHSIYKLFYPKDRGFAKLLKMQLHTRGTGRAPDGKLTYSVDGKRMSGDYNTSMGNILLMCSMMFQYMKEMMIEKYELANEGDDSVIIIEQADLARFLSNITEYFLRLGFTMNVEKPVYRLEHIDFCQSHPVFDGEQYILVRNPWTALPKDTVAKKPLDNPKVYKSWCASVGQSGISLTGGIPVWQEFYQLMDRTSEGAKPIKNDPSMSGGLFWKAWRMGRVYSTPAPEARLSFWHAFGIPPDQQVAIEDHYRNMDIGFSNDQDVLQRFDYCLF